MKNINLNKENKKIERKGKKMNKFKNKKGITLIALVITIIVLLILAAVSISTLTGDNGILTQAQNASNQTVVAQIEEEIAIWQAELIIGADTYTEDEFIQDLIDRNLIEEENINYVLKTIEVNGIEVSYYTEEYGAWVEEYGVNVPKISEGMIPIKWSNSESNWVVCSQDDPDWYNYIDQEGTTDGTSMWANVMLSDGTYKEETVALEGEEIATIDTVIETADLGSMFVWIPRYSYSITSDYHNQNDDLDSGTIEIEFLQGTTDIGSTGKTDWDNVSGEGNWNVHPAFTFGTDEIVGFWMAKFEASEVTTDTVAIIPNVSSWTDEIISDQFNFALNMNENSRYGIDSSVVDTHMTLNLEWGAVAYLSQSSYGRNGIEVTINSNISKVTGSGDYINNTNQSTTGNITGIYDLSGGVNERVAAYVDTEISSSTLTNGASLVKYKDTKYVEVYTVGINNNEINYTKFATIYGNAIYEISSSYTESTSWNSDYSKGPYLSAPFFVRGGSYASGSSAGLFCLFISDGGAPTSLGFRMVVTL